MGAMIIGVTAQWGAEVTEAGLESENLPCRDP